MPTVVTVTVVASQPNAWWHLHIRVYEPYCADSHTKVLSRHPGNATNMTIMPIGVLDTFWGKNICKEKCTKE